MRNRTVLMTAVVAAAMAMGGMARAEEKEIKLDQVPKDVRAAIDQKVAGGEVTEVSTEGTGDKVTYDVEYKKDGKTAEFTVDSSGKVVKEEAAGDKKDEKDEGKKDEKKEGKEEDEVKVKLTDVPAAVKGTLEKEAGGATLPEQVDKEGDAAKAVYEVDVKIDGKNYEIKVSEDGTLVSKKLDKEEDEKGEKKGEKGEKEEGHKDKD